MLEKFSFIFLARWILPRIIHRKKPEGIIVFFSLPCGPLGLFARIWYHIPYVVSLRGGDVPGTEKSLNFFHWLAAPIRRTILNKSSAVIANSRGLADLSLKTDPIPVRVISNGVDTSFFSPARQSDQSSNAFRILFVGRFQKQKNVNLLFEQCARIRGMIKPLCMELHLVGNGPLRIDLERTAKALQINDAIRWYGWTSRNSLPDLYHQADCFINVSLYEGISNSMLEAMACGLPVIASNVIGNNELVINGETGYLFDLALPIQCGDRIVQIASSRTESLSMGAKARQRVVNLFSWDRVADEYLSLFSAKPDGL